MTAENSTCAAVEDHDLTSDRAAAGTTLTATSEPDNPPAAPPVIDGPAGRYGLLEEIDRGGMGAIHRAHDRTLDREVAVKVLHERFAAGSGIARRFIEEARITGQLQHPGIPPVHDLGTLSDGRPFLAMKLIKGRTLDAMLRDRPDTAGDRGLFLAVFEQVCQAVAFAHAHRVIHRDLKPANVMVGAFGEVQVMDWGLAKVLADRPVPAPEPPIDSDEWRATAIRSGRDTDSSETQAGSVLGTPAYMAPEQAIGAIEQVDARSDVFGLGAILAVVLTGRPPFVGENAESTRVLAARAELGDCFALLDASGAEPDLVALCKRCLSAERDGRPPDAGAVAQAVAGLRAAAEERARNAELDRIRAQGERARAEAEARAQQQKRRAQLAIAAGVLGLLVVGGGGWLAVRSQAEARLADAGRVASVALGRAEQLASQAGAIDVGEVALANEAARLWEQAETAIRQAEEALAGAGDAALSARVKDRAALVRSGLAGARRGAALLAALEAARSGDWGTTRGYSDQRGSVRIYRAAFAGAGLPAGGDAAALAAAIRAERPGLREALVRALDGWFVSLQQPPDPDAERVQGAANLADPDPIRKDVRAALAAGDKPSLGRLTERLSAVDLDPDTAAALGDALLARGMAADAVRILRRARDRHPSHLEVLSYLHQALWAAIPDDPVVAEEVVGCARAAVAAHPERAASHYHLGQAYQHSKKDPAAAERHYLKALELNPRFTFAMINLGSMRDQRGDQAGAERWYREAAETDPQFPRAHDGLGWMSEQRGDLAGAEAEYRKAVELNPQDPYANADLARVQRLTRLLPRLDDVVAGRAEPASPAEALGFAAVCYRSFGRRYAAAARLCVQAFETDPRIAAERSFLFHTNTHRYDAACNAALAGCGRGADAPAAPAARAEMRRRSLSWLRADLVMRAGQAASDNPADRETAADRLSRWLEDSDLAGVRPGPGRVDLPADERSAWDALWADVRATLERARKPVLREAHTPK
jgi:tetratricopeptide (TPR) repeat protein